MLTFAEQQGYDAMKKGRQKLTNEFADVIMLDNIPFFIKESDYEMTASSTTKQFVDVLTGELKARIIGDSSICRFQKLTKWECRLATWVEES